jgi:2,4-dienoyl-CoA reductase-like NADH-dependent reductase (Old Yellow Enzyme family)
MAPSAIPQLPAEPLPAALDRAGIGRIKREFVDAAARAARLGIDALELHAAHGYLLHEFLSPISNQRTDNYGGCFDNRVRFPLEVFEAVRAVWPADRPMGVRLSASDWVDGGWTIDESIGLARALKAMGCDWIDASSGGISPAQKIPLGPGYQVQFARAIRRATPMPTMAVGLITDAKQADAIVAAGDADFVALARAMLWDPRWPWHAAATLGAKIVAPPQYWRAAPRDSPAVIAHAKLGMR